MKFLRRILKNNWDILLFITIMFAKLLSANFTLKLNGLSQYTIFGCLGSVFIFVGIAYFLKTRIRIPILFVFDIVLTLIIYINTVYNRYFLDVTTIGLVKQLGITGEVSDSVLGLLSIYDVVFILDIIILIPLYIKFRKNFNFNSL
ncbi:MAG: hypothetical protein RR645_08160, partial [Clostridium sp.]